MCVAQLASGFASNRVLDLSVPKFVVGEGGSNLKRGRGWGGWETTHLQDELTV